ncbi:MAG TPA: hypothetical protein VGG68_00975 [Caulobacteraceae bacterium]|jgi:hypothetical protein
MYAKLRVKLKALAAEARIIRGEEHRARKGWRRLAKKQIGANAMVALHAEFDSLHRHRTYDVRTESRATLLAYAFLRKRPYELTETAGARKAPIDRVANIALRFSEERALSKVMADVRLWMGRLPEVEAAAAAAEAAS